MPRMPRKKRARMVMSGTHGNIAASRAFVNINPLPSSSSFSSPFSRVQTKSNLSSHSLQIIDRSKTSINSYISRYVQENEERDKKEREELELDSCHAFVTVNCLILCKLLIEVKPPSIHIFPERQFSSPCEPPGLQDLVQRSTTLNAPPLNQRYQTTNTKHRPESMTRQQPELLSGKPNKQ